MKWTKEIPKVDGFYWVKGPYYGPTVLPFEFNKHGVICVMLDSDEDGFIVVETFWGKGHLMLFSDKPIKKPKGE